MTETFGIHSLQDLISVIERLSRQHGQLDSKAPLWFRGHRNADWPVQPTLWRHGPAGRYTQSDERNFTHRFRTRAAIRYPQLPLYDDHAGWLSLMQHYGLPTRLLDWSRSPLVAAYFALESYLNPSLHDGEVDAAIWVLSPHLLNLRYAGTGVTPALSSRTCDYLVKSAFKHAESSNTRRARSVIAAMATETDLRMFVQQGCFTVHDEQFPSLEVLDDAHSFIWRIVIPQEIVRDFARQVQILGFRVGDLFPDLEHLADEFKRDYLPGSSMNLMKE